VLDLARRGAGKGDEDVGEGHIDLRLLFPRRHQHREQAEEQPARASSGVISVA
jgi:hypothetical protein